MKHFNYHSIKDLLSPCRKGEEGHSGTLDNQQHIAELERNRKVLISMMEELDESARRIRQSEESQRVLLDNIQTQVWYLTDERTYGAVNKAHAAFMGLNIEDMAFTDMFEFLPNDVAEMCRQSNIAAFAARKPVRTEEWVPHVSGERRLISITKSPKLRHDGTVEYLVCSAEDITERKRAEDELFEERRRLNYIMEATGTHIDILDHDYNLHFVDSGWRKIYGDPEGRKCYEYFMGLDAPCAGCGVPKALAMQAIVVAEEFLRKEHRTLEVHTIPFQSETGEWLVAEFNVDITERKRAEEEKRKLQARLLQAQKMESIGRLAGGVAHDFNNMLQAILGIAEMAMQNLDPAAPLHDDLVEIRRVGERSADLVRQLLAFARKQAIAPRILNLNETVEGMVRMLRHLIGEHIRLVWRPGTELGNVKMDPSQLDQVLTNLCVNARDAISGTGEIVIETDRITLDPTFCARQEGLTPGPHARIAVRDSGRGMDAETLGNLFEPFFTTKGIGEGTGLGLATVYGIVKQNQGHISVHSVPGKGTAFEVYLPLCGSSATDRPTATTVATEPVLGGTETVLLVEDGKEVIRVCKLILNSGGYTVLAADTPEAALRLAAAQDADIHLLVTDIVMPGLSGFELRDRLTARRPGLRTLFMTGYTAQDLTAQGHVANDLALVTKPFSRKGLLSKVREVLDAREG